MIESAEEFVKLRSSEIKEEYNRSAHEEASLDVWMDIISRFPDFKTWVIHNKTVPMQILELLSHDTDPRIRANVATKRKIDDKIFKTLAGDSDELVRYALMCNTKVNVEQIKSIKVDDSEWLQEKLEERIIEIGLENEGK